MIKNEKRMKKATYFFMGTMILLLLVNLYVTINEKNLYSLFGVAYCAWMSYRYVKDLRKINVKISDYENGKLDDMKVFDHEKWKNLMRTKKLERII